MGKEDGLPKELPPERLKKFPNLFSIGHHVTSPNDPTYNCVAYAAGDTSKKWDPFPIYYWPPTVERSQDIECLKDVFRTLGYKECHDGELESGYEKVALYADQKGQWQHAAKQDGRGIWSSKLGNWQDIQHRHPHCFGGSVYGDVYCFMKRLIQ